MHCRRAARPPRRSSRPRAPTSTWSRCGLHGRSPHTQRAYRADSNRFRAFVDCQLPAVTLGDLQAFADELEEQLLDPASRARKLAAVKSLLAFGHQLGYLPFDVGRPLKLPPRKDTLAERILDEADVHRLVALETNRRDWLRFGLHARQ